jgi:hypothetical protein
MVSRLSGNIRGPMVAQRENDRSANNEAATLLAAALAQLDAIKRAQSTVHSSALDAAAGSAIDAVASIRYSGEG